MNHPPQSRDPYLVKSVVHSSKILSAFRAAGEALPLREIAIRSGLPKTMAFRLLYTLEKCSARCNWFRPARPQRNRCAEISLIEAGAISHATSAFVLYGDRLRSFRSVGASSARQVAL